MNFKMQGCGCACQVVFRGNKLFREIKKTMPSFVNVLSSSEVLVGSYFLIKVGKSK